MFKDYSTYQAADYLTDDYFVDSMLEPTPQSEIFWKVLIDDNKINVDEFISAYMTLKNLHDSKPAVSDERLEKLWERIENTNQAKKSKFKRFKFMRYAAAACTIIGVIGFSVFLVMNKGNQSQSIADFARENIIHTQQPSKQIELVSGNQTLAVEGTQAKVEYNANGMLQVNKRQMEVDNEKSTYSQLHVPYGKRAFLKLSDGTSLWVNTGTTVIYPTVFKGTEREIFVEGEVFAEVFHDSKRPFIIKTDRLDVQVLGTVFNVSAYKEDKQVSVVLVSGSVNVKPKNGNATIIKPNQLFAYTDQASTLKNVDVENYVSWHDGVYVFKDEPIESILLRLSRYYNVTMKLPTAASGITCSGKLELKDSLTQLLNGLSEITTMSFGVKDNEYRIKFK